MVGVVTVAAGPDWASATTAIGTVAVAVVAVGVALFAEWRAGLRIQHEHERSDAQLAEERSLHDKETAEERVLADMRLAEQFAHSDAQLAEERAHSTAQLQQERKLAQDREQLAEAYLVQVTEARMTPEAYGSRISADPDTTIECPVAIVVNRGHYTITRLEAQICVNQNSLTSYGKTEHFTSWSTVPQPMTEGLSGGGRDIYLSTLTPNDLGMRYSSDAMVVRDLFGSYPIVRWTDRWGTRWEHKRGEARQIKEGAQWHP